jgi:tetratricopeptide (TPR) repeat protein
VPRIPTQADLEKLSRDEWEELCKDICMTYWDAVPVEDHLGRGNGLDCYLKTTNGIHGWQFRRFNERLGLPQEKELKEALERAKRWSTEKMTQPLVSFTAITSIDLQPSHGKEKGEIERIQELTQWAMSSHQVKFEHHGISWVRIKLLEKPHLRPGMFEDIPRMLKELQDSILSALPPATWEETESKLARALNVLLAQAQVHLRRGHAYHSDEEFRKAAGSISDALSLLEVTSEKAQIASVCASLAAAETYIGRFAQAIEHYQRACIMFSECGKAETLEYWQARAGAAVAMYRSGRYDPAERELLATRDWFRANNNKAETLRTMTHLVELSTQKRDLQRAFELGEELLLSFLDLEDLNAYAPDVTAAFGALASVTLERGEILRKSGQPEAKELIMNAESMYEGVERIGSEDKLGYIAFSARVQRGRCFWFMDDYGRAEELMKDVIARCPSDFGKVIADCQFNLGLMYREMGRLEKSRKMMRDAFQRYRELGDTSAVASARAELRILR